MLTNLTKQKNFRTFSICPENFTGEKGKAGMATEGTGAKCARDLGQGWKVSPSVPVPMGTTFTLADYKGMGAVKHMWITYGGVDSPRDLILRFYWDDAPTPSVEVPLGDFFAAASGGVSQKNFAQINSFAVAYNPRSGMNCYWEMPFRTGFRATLENLSAEKDAVVYYQIDCEEKPISDDTLYFHAQFRRTNPLPYKEVYTILDNIKGNGHYVGTYLYWGVNNDGWWGEGEIKFYIDGDSDFPTVCGTGTEDYFCGSYNWDLGDGYRTYSGLYTGMCKIDATDATYKANRRFSMYRWHITDPIYFQNDLRVTIQALGWRRGGRYLPLQDDISSVAFWYSDRLDDNYPALPDRDGLEII